MMCYRYTLVQRAITQHLEHSVRGEGARAAVEKPHIVNLRFANFAPHPFGVQFGAYRPQRQIRQVVYFNAI